jgi:HEAT repeat protein
MQTLSLNLRKCLTHSLVVAVVFNLFAIANASPVPIKAQSPSKFATSSALLYEMKARKGSSFETVLKSWERKYGSSAVSPLLGIAADRRNEDTERYMALMGAVKLGGAGTTNAIIPLLKDRSWMLRVASLRALKALRSPEAGTAALSLLRDPALVIRSEAVDAVTELHPKGSEDALLATMERAENYHGGKAAWVPQKALAGLIKLRATSSIHRLQPLLRHEGDPELQLKTVEALESLTGKRLAQGKSLKEKIRVWNVELSRK